MKVPVANSQHPGMPVPTKRKPLSPGLTPLGRVRIIKPMDASLDYISELNRRIELTLELLGRIEDEAPGMKPILDDIGWSLVTETPEWIKSGIGFSKRV